MRYSLPTCLLILAPMLVACDQTSFFAKKTQAEDPILVAAAQNKSDVAVAVPPASEVAATAKVEHLTGEDYVISQVQLGNFPCNNNVHVSVTADPANPKLFLVEGKGFSYRMKPVTTKTGAIRLEDEEGGLVWLQVATKSMLMNQKAGKRLADACLSPRQVARAEELGASIAPAAVAAPAAAAATKKAVATKKTTKAAPKKAAAKPAAKKNTAAAKK